MAEDPDDLEAVRTLVGTLEPFEPKTQVRIIRWACEKLGVNFPASHSSDIVNQGGGQKLNKVDGQLTPPAAHGHRGLDIKSFIAEKDPSSNNEFAACVAYYYRFEAPAGAEKEAINGDDLLDACRLAGRNRLSSPNQTLINAHTSGLVDKAEERGKYIISTVGENLVAMTLPSDGTAKRAMSAGGKKRAKAKAAKKTSKKKAKKKAN
ncbi:MAG: hypothetical protein NXI29_14330 [bacterium]|nr:hypothetical protein [bacterium]